MRRWMLAVVMAAVFLCTACTAAPQYELPESTAAPAAGPLSGLTIVVDPGHGGYDGGARCADSSLWEKQLNLEIALRVEQALQARGANVLMTRRTDMALCDDQPPQGKTLKRQDLERRVALAADNRADMVLSIHMNEYRARSESGPQVFYRAQCTAGRLLAGCMQEALITALQPSKRRSAMAGDYFVLQLDTPSILIECGFISNANEERLLRSPAYQDQLAQAIAEGAVMYVGMSEGTLGENLSF